MKFTEITEVLALLTPWDIIGPAKVRVGRAQGDGGYILLDTLLKDQKVYSFGVGKQITFDLELAERGHDIYLFDHTVSALPTEHPRFHFFREGVSSVSQPDKALFSLEQHIDRLGHRDLDLILKMDVEGAEWGVLATAGSGLIRKFSQITMELHGLDRLGNEKTRARACRVLRKLNRTHTLFHVHGNNAVPLKNIDGITVAPLLEVSYVRSDLVERVRSRTFYPTVVDAPNVSRKPDHVLWFYPFYPYLEPESVAGEVMQAARRLDVQAKKRLAKKSREANKRSLADGAVRPSLPARG
ncbi:FkbM family methyltransferase [Methylotetracoccus oryzae]|uniref:FkbM family methyltransferase n=1 Tax=Methylotetracoccus oryzae TaxID=1919059 RepID=UPI001119941B|nr:FkbM family methyltransferase [Methylotetracoccus oryzae]